MRRKATGWLTVVALAITVAALVAVCVIGLGAGLAHVL